MILWRLFVSLLPRPVHLTNGHIVLEQAPGRDKKRRATDFVFKRLRAEEIGDLPQRSKHAEKVSSGRPEKQRSASQSDDPGIPLIRTTLPGDEVNDMKALKAAIRSRAEGGGPVDVSKSRQLVSTETTVHVKTAMIKVPINARHFHLSREQERLGPPRLHAGVRKSVHYSKANLATFVEKGLARTDQHMQSANKVLPIDRVVEVMKADARDEGHPNAAAYAEDQTQVLTTQTFDQSFVKPSAADAKTGRSINTHPSTWDFDSDQLASELAAFAFELDPAGEADTMLPSKAISIAAGTELVMQEEEEYIYETYIRLPHNAAIQTEIEQHNLTANIGVLIIAEEDEELWEAYAENDSDDEWDEEDADSNGRKSLL
jgi:hypothetical protein